MEKNNMTEMVTFIPQDESALANGNAKKAVMLLFKKAPNVQVLTEATPLCPAALTSKYSIQYEISKGDPEAANALSGQFDPFKARVLEHPVSETGTLIHLLKSCLGTGILAMPFAFKCAGLVVGIFATLVESLICTHCAYVLVVCAHELYKKSGRTSMTFADVAEEACRRGPPWSKKYSGFARRLVDIGIFVTYFGTCSAYTVIVAKNFDKVTAVYWGPLNIRLYLLILLLPLILLCYVPNLKYLTPVSMIANVFMALGLGITCYYLVMGLPQIENKQLAASIETFPTFFSITIFALEAIGVVMPLENNMQRPQRFVGLTGILNQGMAGVTLGYILIGFLGYLRFGDKTLANVTLNLPEHDILAQSVQILIALAVFCTFGLQFFICLEIVWNGIKDRYKKNATLANYILRTVLVFVSIGIAIAVPTIGPFISLIGAFCFSILGLLVPIFIEVVTFWEKGFGKYNWRMVKNVIVVLTGVLALIFGTKSALEDIVNMYVGDTAELVPVSDANTTLANLLDTTTELLTTV